MSQNVYNSITSKTMLYTIATKCVLHPKGCCTQLPGKLFNIENDVISNCQENCICNIENDVIHNRHKMCITSETMLYTIARKSVQHPTRCYTQWSQNVYNIGNDAIHNGHKMCITSKTMLYKIARKTV